MPVVARYLNVTASQGMPNAELDSKGCATCRILPDNGSNRGEALGFAVAGTPARSNRLLIASLAAVIVLTTGAVSGCSHSNSTPEATAPTAPTATPAPAASPAPNASPLAGVWRNDDVSATDDTFEVQVTQADQTVYLKTCKPNGCTATYTGQLTADSVANFSLQNGNTAKTQIDPSGHLLVLVGSVDPDGFFKPGKKTRFHRVG